MVMSIHGGAETLRHFAAALQSNPAYSEARLMVAETLRASGPVKQSLVDETMRLNPRLVALSRLSAARVSR